MSIRHRLLCPSWFLKTDVYLHLDEKAVPCRLYSPGANTLYTASKCNGCIKVSEEDWLFRCNAEVIVHIKMWNYWIKTVIW